MKLLTAKASLGALLIFLLGFLATEIAVAQDLPRGYVTRKGVRYMYEIQFEGASSKKHIIRIKKEDKGRSYLVYSSNVVSVKKDDHHMIKIYEAHENGYRWDIDRESFIKMKFMNDGTIDPEVVGNMKNYVDNNHGLSSAELKAKCTPKDRGGNANLQEIEYLKATCRYLIYKYTKVMK